MNNYKIPNQLIQMLKGGNPQQILTNMLQQNCNNPMAQNIISMMNNNDSQSIENIARNICASRGINADELMSSVKDQFG